MSGQTRRWRTPTDDDLAPSMEGRTIVRPDRLRRGDVLTFSTGLQWRAGQLSGQTGFGDRLGTVQQRPSMEGRTIVRPDRALDRRIRQRASSFNGGPDNCPARRRWRGWRCGSVLCLQWRAGQLSGQTLSTSQQITLVGYLQWRAGQLSGQTSFISPMPFGYVGPSMEGRTIVRPDRSGAVRRCGEDGPSMEGRTIVRPDEAQGRVRKDNRVPSMEGRTIVRPDPTPHDPTPLRSTAFNGGPDNCPARPAIDTLIMSSFLDLQWRAGQLSGQTGITAVPMSQFGALQWRAGQLSGQTHPPDRGAPLLGRPSMEGRTIVRPDVYFGFEPYGGRDPFNGGPDNCPARHVITLTSSGSAIYLQWRAGQLSGQTPCWWSARRDRADAFNGGPDNCPARLAPLVALAIRTQDLQWRAGQLSGQTCRGLWRSMTTAVTFNGGPDNCPARPGDPAVLAESSIDPSMEGRTIVRPDSSTARSSPRANRPSMEGRTIVRPDGHPSAGSVPPDTTFNGGPDNCPARHLPDGDCRGRACTFNGGPDNCPARPLRDLSNE